MNIQSNIESILNKMASISGNAPPSFDEDGRCALEIQDISILLEAPANSPTFLLMTIVYRGPALLEIFTEALSGNLYWNKTKGSTLMWEKASKSLILCIEKDAQSIDFNEFTKILSDFHASAHHWLETCQRLQEEAQDAQSKY